MKAKRNTKGELLDTITYTENEYDIKIATANIESLIWNSIHNDEVRNRVDYELVSEERDEEDRFHFRIRYDKEKKPFNFVNVLMPAVAGHHYHLAETLLLDVEGWEMYWKEAEFTIPELLIISGDYDGDENLYKLIDRYHHKYMDDYPELANDFEKLLDMLTSIEECSDKENAEDIYIKGFETAMKIYG